MDKLLTGLELLPIDFDLPLDKLAEWYDKWRVERYGKDSIDPIKYYIDYADGRFLVERPKEGEALGDEKANCEEVLRLLVEIRLINQKLSGKGLSRHLQYAERERLKKKRERLYNGLKQKAGVTPQREREQSEKVVTRKGRQKKSLIDKMLCSDKEAMLEKLRTLAQGKKGKDFALIIRTAVKEGIMMRPTYGEVNDAFGDIGNQSGYNKYMGNNAFSDEEFEGMTNKLR